MRETKYRAYITSLDNLFEVASINFEDNEIFIILENGSFHNTYNLDYELNQYIGLKDKNGNDVYEGDILSNGKVFQDVYWNDRTASFSFNSKNTKGWSIRMSESLEIVGNIYDSPDLLNKSIK